MRRIFSRVRADCAARLHRVSVRSTTNGTPAGRMWNGFGAEVPRLNPSVIGCHPPAPDWTVHHLHPAGAAWRLWRAAVVSMSPGVGRSIARGTRRGEPGHTDRDRPGR